MNITKNGNRIILLIILFLGIFWFCNNTTREGMDQEEEERRTKERRREQQKEREREREKNREQDRETEREKERQKEKEKNDPPPPPPTTESMKKLAANFKKQMKAAGIPSLSTSDFNSLFSQFYALIKQQMTSSIVYEDDLDIQDKSTPVVDTIAPPIPFPDTTFFAGSKFSDAFCRINSIDPGKLNSQCATLTSENCNATDCCIWVNGTKCVAGSAKGPTYIGSKTTDSDYYSHKYQCYGRGCRS